MVIGCGTPCSGEVVIESRSFLSRKSLSRFICYEIQYIERGTLAYNSLREKRTRANSSIRESIAVVVFVVRHYRADCVRSVLKNRDFVSHASVPFHYAKSRRRHAHAVTNPI